MAVRTASINVRLDQNDKREAEGILREIGLSMSGAVNMMVKAIIRERRLPFNTAVPARTRGGDGLFKPLNSDREYVDYVNGLIADKKNDKYLPADEVRDQINWNS